MQLEVEQKYVVNDEIALRKSLLELGFDGDRQEVHSDTYFRHPSRDFRVTGEAFRLRQVDNESCVTYKGPKQSSEIKTRQEIELQLQASDTAHWFELLETLGFRRVPEVKKTRCIFLADSEDNDFSGCTVTIDTVEQLGVFCEIETVIQPGEDPTAAQEVIRQLDQQLPLGDVQPLSYLAMFLQQTGIED